MYGKGERVFLKGYLKICFKQTNPVTPPNTPAKTDPAWQCRVSEGSMCIWFYETKAALSQLHLRHLIGTVVMAFEMDG